MCLFQHGDRKRPDRPDNDRDQRPARSRPLIKEAGEKQRADRGVGDGPEFLDIDEDGFEVAEEIADDGSRRKHQQRHPAAEAHEVLAGGVTPDVVLVDVERDNGGAGGHHGGNVRHHTAHQPCHHQPGQTGGQQLLHQRREGQVALDQRAGGFEHPRIRIVEAESHNPRQDDQERHQQLQETREHNPHLAVPDVTGGQSALGDELVAAPVEDVGQPHAAEEHTHPRQFRIVPRPYHVELLRGTCQHRFESSHN